MNTTTELKPVRQRKRRAEATAAPTPVVEKGPGKLALLVQLMRRENGASVPEMMEATGWQAHSIRGAMAGTLKKKQKLQITSAKDAGGERRYRIAEQADVAS